MDEEVIDYLYKWALSDGFKRSKEDFVNLLQKDDEVLSYAFDFAQKDGFKKDKNALGLLVGRTGTAPVATAEPAKTESVAEEPVKTEPVKTEVVAETKTELAKELSNKPLETKKAESIPAREAEMPTADTTKMPTMMVREAEPEVKEETKKEMPIGENLLPVTEKTEVKAVETPSDKMVIKSEKKGKGKVAPEPIKIEPIKFETKEGPTQIEVPTFAIPEPKKKYKPYGEKGPDVYYSEDSDQFIIKEGNERTVASKGSPKYAEIETKLAQAVGATKEGKGKCDAPPFEGCSKERTALSDFKYYKGDDYAYGYGRIDEGGLIETLDDRKRTIENRGESLWSIYYNKKGQETYGDIYYANQEPPKSDRFITYKPFDNDKTLIYDKESGIILKQLDQKAPFVDLKGNSDPRSYWQKYARENPNEGLTVWQGFEIDHPEYKELKSIIEGIDYKKAKGTKNTFIPTFNPVPETPEWQK